MDTASKETIQKIKEHLTDLINRFIKENEFAIDIQTDVAFKDINKTEVKLLVKNLNNSYDAKNLEECGHKLNQYQTINYIVRVFIDRDAANFTLLKTSLPSNINSILEEHLIKK
jgi:uncharacterized protein